jgi:hypothetical protein
MIKPYSPTFAPKLFNSDFMRIWNLLQKYGQKSSSLKFWVKYKKSLLNKDSILEYSSEFLRALR